MAMPRKLLILLRKLQVLVRRKTPFENLLCLSALLLSKACACMLRRAGCSAGPRRRRQALVCDGGRPADLPGLAAVDRVCSAEGWLISFCN